VRVDREGEPSGLPEALDELLRAVDRQRRLALRQEEEGAVRLLAQQRPDQPQLVALKAVDAWRAVLGAPDVDRRRFEVWPLGRPGI
jgi:hypothetical protein